MQIAVSPLDKPISSSNWQTNVSVLQAHPLFGHGAASLERLFVRPWLWSRKASKAAQALAAASTDPYARALLQRWSLRHAGVWTSANKLVRKGADGREIRAIAAVRSDAGDATCPTWLLREGISRATHMTPIVEAARMQGHYIMIARSVSVSRADAERARLWLTETMRYENSLLGLDILLVPDSVNTVRMFVLGIFADSSPLTVSPPNANITLAFSPCVDFSNIYMEAYESALKLEPEQWLLAQLNCHQAGKRMRDRVTVGCLYGKAANAMVAAAANAAIDKTPPDIVKEVASTGNKIAKAIDIAIRASAAGDFHAAQAAVGFAKAYVEDARGPLEGFPVLEANLAILADYDLSGLDNAPVMAHIHDAFMAEIRALPTLKPRANHDWTCIEHVVIHGPEDIRKLALWMREASE